MTREMALQILEEMPSGELDLDEYLAKVVVVEKANEEIMLTHEEAREFVTNWRKRRYPNN